MQQITIKGGSHRYLSELEEFKDGIPFGIINKTKTDVIVTILQYVLLQTWQKVQLLILIISTMYLSAMVVLESINLRNTLKRIQYIRSL